jgi:DNA-binding NarL/FixJ family response regulator
MAFEVVEWVKNSNAPPRVKGFVSQLPVAIGQSHTYQGAHVQSALRSGANNLRRRVTGIDELGSAMSESHRSAIRIFLIDDSELVRRGVKSVLASTLCEPPMQIVGEAATVADGVNGCLRLQPHIVILDIRLPDGSGFDACRQILAQLPRTRVLMLTAHSNDNLVYDAVTAGAHGYLMKEIDGAGLIQALQDVAAGRSILDPEATGRVLRLLRGGTGQSGPDLSVLSAQERRVLALVAEGLTNKQAGTQLGLSENTVKNYLVSVFEKLQVKRRAQAAAIYVQQAAAEK